MAYRQVIRCNIVSQGTMLHQREAAEIRMELALRQLKLAPPDIKASASNITSINDTSNSLRKLIVTSGSLVKPPDRAVGVGIPSRFIEKLRLEATESRNESSEHHIHIARELSTGSILIASGVLARSFNSHEAATACLGQDAAAYFLWQPLPSPLFPQPFDSDSRNNTNISMHTADHNTGIPLEIDNGIGGIRKSLERLIIPAASMLDEFLMCKQRSLNTATLRITDWIESQHSNMSLTSQFNALDDKAILHCLDAMVPAESTPDVQPEVAPLVPLETQTLGHFSILQQLMLIPTQQAEVYVPSVATLMALQLVRVPPACEQHAGMRWQRSLASFTADTASKVRKALDTSPLSIRLANKVSNNRPEVAIRKRRRVATFNSAECLDRAIRDICEYELVMPNPCEPVNASDVIELLQEIDLPLGDTKAIPSLRCEGNGLEALASLIRADRVVCKGAEHRNNIHISSIYTQTIMPAKASAPSAAPYEHMSTVDLEIIHLVPVPIPSRVSLISAESLQENLKSLLLLHEPTRKRQYTDAGACFRDTTSHLLNGSRMALNSYDGAITQNAFRIPQPAENEDNMQSEKLRENPLDIKLTLDAALRRLVTASIGRQDLDAVTASLGNNALSTPGLWRELCTRISSDTGLGRIPQLLRQCLADKVASRSPSETMCDLMPATVRKAALQDSSAQQAIAQQAQACGILREIIGMMQTTGNGVARRVLQQMRVNEGFSMSWAGELDVLTATSDEEYLKLARSLDNGIEQHRLDDTVHELTPRSNCSGGSGLHGGGVDGSRSASRSATSWPSATVHPLSTNSVSSFSSLPSCKKPSRVHGLIAVIGVAMMQDISILRSLEFNHGLNFVERNLPPTIDALIDPSTALCIVDLRKGPTTSAYWKLSDVDQVEHWATAFSAAAHTVSCAHIVAIAPGTIGTQADSLWNHLQLALINLPIEFTAQQIGSTSALIRHIAACFARAKPASVGLEQLRKLVEADQSPLECALVDTHLINAYLAMLICRCYPEGLPAFATDDDSTLETKCEVAGLATQQSLSLRRVLRKAYA